MTEAFAGQTLMYTIRAEERPHLLEAVEQLDPDHFEVVLKPGSSISDVTLLTQDLDGLVEALNDVAPRDWHEAIVRVYDGPRRSARGGAS